MAARPGPPPPPGRSAASGPIRPVPDETVAQRFARQAARTPDRVAVRDAAAGLTYAALDHEAAMLAERLTARGVRRGEVVGLRMTRSIRLPGSILALWRIGAAYTALDPALPQARSTALADDAGVRFVIEDGADGPVIRRRTTGGTAPAVDGCAYLAYTSGSTGRSKGVLVAHRSVTNLVTDAVRRFGFNGHDVVMAVSSPSFDISVLELWCPLTTGATVDLADDDTVRDGALLADRLRSGGATVMQATPTTWRMLSQRSRPVRLRAVLCGGEPLLPDLAERLHEWSDSVWNLYGPTETTVWSTAARLRPGRPVTAGTPIANTRVYVLGADGAPVPRGRVGEVAIAGAGVAIGYHRLPAATAERFPADPVHGGSRAYLTGDRARMDGDGAIELLGRDDDQVKIDGHRLELGEVEAALAADDTLEQAAVVARTDTPGSVRLRAFAVRSDSRADTGAVRARLLGLLPAHAVPTEITFMDALPLLPSGKIDRAALRSAADAPAAAPPPDMPSLERRIAALWRDVLRVDRIDDDADFFAIGGRSLDAATVVAQIETATGEVAYTSELYAHPRLADFCAHLRSRHPRLAAALASEPVRDAPGESSAPLTPDMIERFRSLVTGPETRDDRAASPVAFILSAPRSGSTLLRAMLAGHSRLFAPPELELLGFATMAERDQVLHGCRAPLGDGLLRALRDLLDGDPWTPERWLRGPDAPRTTAAMYDRLGGLTGGRLLIDKTTTYAMDEAALARATRMFASPKVIHLVRHPAAAIRSYADARLEEVFRYDHPFSARQLAELIWLQSNRNVEALLARLPGADWTRVRYEDLAEDPENCAKQVTELLGVDFEPRVLDPYDGAPDRMTDGLHPQSRMAGDFKFGRFDRIVTDRVDAWRAEPDPVPLSRATKRIAEHYGYRV